MSRTVYVIETRGEPDVMCLSRDVLERLRPADTIVEYVPREEPRHPEQICAFCPHCGANPRVDEDGCCDHCGSDAVGSGVDALAELLRTPEEDAVLQAALEWREAWVYEDESVGIVKAEEQLVAALDALPKATKARLRGAK